MPSKFFHAKRVTNRYMLLVHVLWLIRNSHIIFIHSSFFPSLWEFLPLSFSLCHCLPSFFSRFCCFSPPTTVNLQKVSVCPIYPISISSYCITNAGDILELETTHICNRSCFKKDGWSTTDLGWPLLVALFVTLHGPME